MKIGTRMNKIINMRGSFTMASIKPLHLHTILISLLIITSCHEPLGIGGQLYFFPQTCDTLCISNEGRQDYLCFHVEILGKEASHDYALEDQISSWDHWVFGSSILWGIRYTDEVCTSIQITSSERLFGLDPGSDLSRYFSVTGNGVPDELIISSDKDSPKQLIGPFPIIGMTLEEYLSYSPLIAPSMLLFSEPLVVEHLIENNTQFTVTFSFLSGKQLTSTSGLTP